MIYLVDDDGGDDVVVVVIIIIIPAIIHPSSFVIHHSRFTVFVNMSHISHRPWRGAPAMLAFQVEV